MKPHLHRPARRPSAAQLRLLRYFTRRPPKLPVSGLRFRELTATQYRMAARLHRRGYLENPPSFEYVFRDAYWLTAKGMAALRGTR